MENKHGGLPFGFKFKPTNPELIWFLLLKVHGSPLPCNSFIIDYDMYGKKDRWKEIYEGIPAASPHLYFFTKLKKITGKRTLKEGGGNWNRKTSGGTWKETQNCGTIYDPNTKKPVGNKRSFKFQPNPDIAAEFTGRWLMDEFSLDSRFAHQNVDDYVVCCIKHEGDRRSKNTVEQTRNSGQLIQEDCRNTSNNDSINGIAAATTLVPEDGLADFGDQNLCLDSDELHALLDDSNQLLGPMIEENGQGSDCQFTGRWLMDEFSLDSRFAHQNVDDYVVCCIKHKRDRKSKNKVQQTRNSELLIQEDSRNTSNADSINDTAAATTLDPEGGLADFGDLDLCFDSNELNALLDDSNQLLAPMIEENGRDSECGFVTLKSENGAADNAQTRVSEQVFEVDCKSPEANNYATEATISDFENDTEEFEDPNMWLEFDELLGNLDQTSAETVEENVSGLDCQFATSTTLSGPGVGSSNCLTNTSSCLMDTPIHNQISEEKAATSQH